MDQQFLSAFIAPDKWEILWYELNPYSIRIYTQLSAINSPYIVGQVPTPEDTVLFLKICSSNNGNILKIPKLSFFDKLLNLKLKLNKRFHTSLYKSIMFYMSEYTNVPRIVVTKNGEEVVVKKSNVPEIFLLSSICMSKMNISEKEVMNMSFCKLSWYGYAAAIIEGGEVRLQTKEEELKATTEAEELYEYIKEQAEKLKIAMVNGKIKKRKIIIK